MKSKKFILIVLIPMIIYMCVFMLFPIIMSGVLSFMDYNPLRENNFFVGFKNYVSLLVDAEYTKSLSNTLIFVFFTLVINIIISLGLSYLITDLASNKTRSFFRALVFLPCVVPLVASSVVFGRSIFPTKNGLLNMIISSLGGSKINWLGDGHVLLFSIILFTLWADVGYNTILFSAGMDGIPQELYDASSIDGAGKWKKFTAITFPLLTHTTSFVVLMTLISYFKMFAQFNVLAFKGGPQNSGMVLTSLIYKSAFEYKKMGLASAEAVTLFIFIFVIAMIQQKSNKTNWEY